MGFVMIFQNAKLEAMAKRVEMYEVSNEASSNGDLVEMKHEPQFDRGPWLPKSSQVSKTLHSLPVTDFLRKLAKR